MPLVLFVTRRYFLALTHHISQPENILVDKHGKHLKLADFGSCRGINGRPPFTEYISTRWYRPPECLLTCGMYGPEMDVWGAGCILFELTTLYPLFPGSDEADQIHRIHRVLGTPKASIISKFRKHASSQANFAFPKQEGIGLSKLLPDVADNCLDLLKQSVAYDTSDRITSKRAAKHPYFVGDHAFPPVNVTHNATRGRTRRAKIAPGGPQSIPSASSFPSDPTKMAESDKASGPVHIEVEAKISKPRSMVSILLARLLSFDDFSAQNNKKEFVQESKARNNTFHRKGGGKNNVALANKEKATSHRTNLPKLKSLVPDSKGSTENSSFKKHTRRQPKKYAHIRSSGYGTSTVAPIPKPLVTNKLPPLNESAHHSHGYSKFPARRFR
ncbi:hypothetical protein ACHAWF_017136 [Thalassiosira exigua]